MLHLLKIDNVFGIVRPLKSLISCFCVILRSLLKCLALVFLSSLFLFALSISGQTAGKSIILFWNVALNYI